MKVLVILIKVAIFFLGVPLAIFMEVFSDPDRYDNSGTGTIKGAMKHSNLINY